MERQWEFVGGPFDGALKFETDSGFTKYNYDSGTFVDGYIYYDIHYRREFWMGREVMLCDTLLTDKSIM